MMFSLLLRQQIVKFFSGCTGRLRQMGMMLEDAAATRRTSGQTDVFVSMFVCSSDARI